MPSQDQYLNEVIGRDTKDFKQGAPTNPSILAQILKRAAEPLVAKPKPVDQPKYVVAVDFDGTCVTHEFPKVGKDCPHVIEVLKEIVAHGAGLVLFTMRHGEYLDEAVNWFAERGIPLYGIQTNPTQASWTGSNKCYAHIYIDDAALGCPLIHNESFSKRPYVDWIGVDRLLQKHDWFMESIVKPK